MQTVGQERLEEEGEVGSIVTAVDDTNYLLMDIVISDIAGDTSVEMLEDSEDMPEDLSTKHRTVSVQTETCDQERFEQLFDGYPQDQIRYFMNILIHFASKNDLGNLKNELTTFYKKVEQVTF
jgi:hypothetical protein